MNGGIKYLLATLIAVTSITTYRDTNIALAVDNGNSLVVDVPTEPTFPSCKTPQGTLKASYDEGTHGIPGDSNTYTGEDKVYTLSTSTLSQCLCTDEGEGIQTNWWKASSLTSEEIEILTKLGWVYVPDGEAWGLDDSVYLAKSSSYECRDGDDDDDGEDGEDPNDKHDPPRRRGGIGGQVLGAFTSLASTGNAQLIAGLLGVGSLALAASLMIRKKDE